MLDEAQLLTAPGEAFVLTTEVALRSDSEVVAAFFRGTAHGVFEVTIDGVPVSEGVLAPGWSAYEWRLPVEEYDVSPLVRDGSRLNILVGNGWWRGKLGFDGLGLNYGERIGFIGELEILYANGDVQTIPTGPQWTAMTASITSNSIYDGIRIDPTTVAHPLPVTVGDIDRSALVPQIKPPILRQETIAPQRIWKSASGNTLVDFGQNLVGWTRLRANGPAQSEIVVRHAEVLESGELATYPLRGAKATDTFVLSGDDDVFEPTLTFHGFRYVEVSGFPGELGPDDIEAVVVHSRMNRTGYFECSDPRVNRLVENAVWGQKGNFLGLPTDCPQRDERLGWTGDIAVYAPSACFQFDCADLLHGWLLDLRAEAQHSGYVPFLVPNLLRRASLGALAAVQGPTAIWGDAAAWVPEALWWAFGDRDRLAEHYPAIVIHLESILPRLSVSGLWDTGFQFGDWLDPDAPWDRPLDSKADPGVVATACLYRTAQFAACAAAELGYDLDAARWEDLADRTREAFNAHYVDEDSRIRSDAQTAYALAIHFGLLDRSAVQRAGERLAQLVESENFHVATGFAGTPYLTWALTETGHTDTAYRLLLQDTLPSWLYEVGMGATTIWERWDSLLPDGSVNPDNMTSFNHYAPGAIVNWLYQCVAGIRPATPGYARIHLEPTPGPGLDWARGKLHTPHGTVECGWRRRSDSVITVDCVIPEGVEADLLLPDGQLRVLHTGAYSVSVKEKEQQ
ncbi:family 78 glycoside hydrolase catalytic domain [Nocardia thailandica]